MAGAMLSVLKNRCPRCRKGPLFINSNPYVYKDLSKMHKTCPECQQDFVIEPGFYFGASYVSYGINFMYLIPLFLFFYVVMDWSFNAFLITVFVSLPLLMPLIYRASRSAFLAFYVKFDEKIAAQVRTNP